MQPFYQGKIDNFCAIYAVLNAVQVIHQIRPLRARDIFNDTLLDLSKDIDEFKAVLEHKTDYCDLVDKMLLSLAKQFPLKVQAPFAADAPCQDVWQTLTEYANPDTARTAIFRFVRYEALNYFPLADHWSTTLRMDAKGLHLFDCSLEPKGMYQLRKEDLAQTVAMRKNGYFVIPSESVRLLSLP